MRPGTIYVDSRVGSKELEPLLSGKRHRIPTKLCTLRSADFAFTCGHTRENPFCKGDRGCTIGIERKVLSDMVGSLVNDRLIKQVPDMLDDYTMAWVVVEDIWRPGADDAIEIFRYGEWRAAPYRLTYSQLSGWMVRFDVCARGRLARWRTSSTTETAAFIASVFHWWQKEWHKHRMSTIAKGRAPMKSVMFRPTQLQMTARSFRGCGVGDVNAKMLGRRFKSIHAMMNASVEELRAVGGLGRKAAEKLYAEIRKEYR